MIQKILELHDSYKSPEARKLVDYVWDITDKSLDINTIYKVIKSCADDSEELFRELKGEK